MKRYLVSTAIAALLVAGPAMAAEQPAAQAPGATPPAASGATESSAPTQAGALQFVSSQKESDWLANNLIGRSVQNSQGDTLGEINDVVLDEGGQVAAVLIGVGGFLGIGQKNVGIAFDSLEFKEAPREAPVTSTSPPAGSPGAGMGGGNPMAGAARDTAPQANKPDPAHGNMIIVLNATKEQLENAPSFTRLGDEPEQAKASDRLAPETGKSQ
ncbi:MAG: PRC-barrel domain-containing protein [Hyphomicrobiales bacterium]